MPKPRGVIYAYTTPAYRRTRWSGRRRGRGLVKVGYTRRDPHVRIREQIGASSPEKTPYSLLLTARAATRRGKPFTDKDVHRELARLGVRNVHNEWFEARPEDVRRALSNIGGKADRGLKRARRKTRKRRSVRTRRRNPVTAWIVCAAIAVMLISSLAPQDVQQSLRQSISSATTRLLPGQ